ncbi:sigma-70 family RNA polymerase sigma factor [Catenulispora rubra]|uniref:sigma-70 family RNA polymerase sigma factor n=1 Tax=Catenulispora rubra TaxID=280293 RepID=UPI00189213F3|nr:sigma-70 family RNA polymerase sigma factor [Catenulispora rubra]
MITADDLHDIDDPLELFQKATDGISQLQTEIDQLAEIRSRSLAELYVRGKSYRDLAQMLGMSAPRVSQLVSANDAASMHVIKAWAKLESTIADVAGLSQRSPARAPAYHRALEALRDSGRFDEHALRALEDLRRARNMLVHGQRDVSVEEAEKLVDSAIYLNALMQVILRSPPWDSSESPSLLV